MKPTFSALWMRGDLLAPAGRRAGVERTWNGAPVRRNVRAGELSIPTAQYALSMYGEMRRCRAGPRACPGLGRNPRRRPPRGSPVLFWGYRGRGPRGAGIYLLTHGPPTQRAGRGAKAGPAGLRLEVAWRYGGRWTRRVEIEVRIQLNVKR